MTLNIFLILLSILSSSIVVAQTKVGLPRPVNTSLTNEKNPAFSGDGRYLIFETDYGETNLYPVISKTIASMYSRPEELQTVFNKTTRDGAFSLNYNGNEVYFSSYRYGGLGKADLWYSRKNGDKWESPVNFGKPINSSSVETDPSISPDGQKLFFVRLSESTDSDEKRCGKIYISEKKGKTWSQPEPLPETINNGCECSPRILTDNKTLIFSSIRKGSKGGLDYFSSVLKEDGSWSTPVPLSLYNTEGDDVSAAVPGNGNYIYVTAKAHGKDDIFKMKLSDEFKPLPTTRVLASIKSEYSQKPIPSKIIISKNDGKELDKLYNNGGTGEFETVIAGKDTVELTIYPLLKGYFYSTIQIIPGETTISQNIFLKPLKKGVSQKLQLTLDKNEVLSEQSKLQLRKVAKTLSDNPEVTVEIVVVTPKDISNFQKENLSDTIPNHNIEENTIESNGLEKGQVLAEKIKGFLVTKGISTETLTTKVINDSDYETSDLILINVN